MKIDSDGLTFSTGKRIYAHRGIVGLCLANADGRNLLFHGYDGQIMLPGDEGIEPEDKLTPEECVKLADEMLKRWTEFRATYAKA